MRKNGGKKGKKHVNANLGRLNCLIINCTSSLQSKPVKVINNLMLPQ